MDTGPSSERRIVGYGTKIGQISTSFSELHDEVLGRVHVAIRSASELPGDSRSRIVAALKAKLQREIIDTASVDESLIGGMTIRIGDTQVDGSVKTKLNKVREAMASQRFGNDLFQ